MRKLPAPGDFPDVSTSFDRIVQDLRREYDFPREVHNHVEAEEFLEKYNEDPQRDDEWHKVLDMLNNIEEYISLMKEWEQQDGILIWRALTAQGRQGIRMDEVGVFWSFREGCEQPHWGTYAEGYEEFVLFGVVRPEYVDWYNSLVLYANYGDMECEIRLLEGVPVTIIGINGEELPTPIEATA